MPQRPPSRVKMRRALRWLTMALTPIGPEPLSPSSARRKISRMVSACSGSNFTKPARHSAGLLYLALALTLPLSPPCPLFPLVEDGIANAAPIVLCLLGKPRPGRRQAVKAGASAPPRSGFGLEGLTVFRFPLRKQTTDF